MRLCGSQFDEVVAIAGKQEAVMCVCELDNGGIRRRHGQYIAKPDNLVIELTKQIDEILWNVMIEQKLHG
jgi:hypothetical protein